MGPPTDPGPSGSARVSKWSVRPWHRLSDIGDQHKAKVPHFSLGQSIDTIETNICKTYGPSALFYFI
ncbi:unnamed protein product, partial [Staurois parvus]